MRAVRAVPVIASLLAACGAGSPEPAPEAASDASPAAVQVELPAEAAPASAPIAKAPTLAELNRSCPLGDGARFDDLRAFAERGDFARIDAEMQKMLDAYRQTHACEHHLWNTFGFLAGLDFAPLDRWTAVRPDSWAAFTARGIKWVETGYQRRGVRLARDVTETQWAGMREAFAQADRDLMRALQLEPDDFVAYGNAIYRLQSEGDPAQIVKALDAMLERDPYNVGLRRTAMQALSPYWGGSIEAMRRVAEDAQRHADRNPRLRILPGYVEAEAARVHWFGKRYAEAAAGYSKALAYGDDADWYGWLANCLSRTEDWNGLLRTADLWLAALGEDASAHNWRGRALRELGKLPQALEEFDRAIALAPHFGYALNLRGITHKESGRLAEAAADLRHGLEHEYTSWALNALIEVAAADPAAAAQTEAVARKLAEAHSQDPGAWFLLASVLHARGAGDARGALERYVALAQGDGDESARLAKARRMLDPRPATRTLPALSRLGLAAARS
jgi:tetratricopeptide (TPR) repeat protein